MANDERINRPVCSFCGKPQEQVRRLVAGPGVFICDECVELCREIIEEDYSDATNVELEELPKPHEMMRILNEYVIGQDEAKKNLWAAILLRGSPKRYCANTCCTILASGALTARTPF